MRGVGCTGESPGQMTGRKKTGRWHLRTETKLKFPFPFSVALETGGIVVAGCREGLVCVCSVHNLSH